MKKMITHCALIMISSLFLVSCATQVKKDSGLAQWDSLEKGKKKVYRKPMAIYQTRFKK